MPTLELQKEAVRVQEPLAHIPALDGIRGVAILMVLVYHFLWYNTATGGAFFDQAMKLQRMGWMGVDLFFALSGFLITGILYDSLGDRRFFRNFYARRVFRIFPLYYAVLLSLLLYFAFAHLVTPVNLKLLGLNAIYLQNTPAYLDYPVMTPAFLYTGHLWSLAVEEQFYFVWPLLVFLVRDRVRLMGLALGLALLAPISRLVLLAYGSPANHLYHFTLCRQDSLLFGAWLALAYRGPLRQRVLKYAPIPFVLCLVYIAAVLHFTGNFYYQTNPQVIRYGLTVIAIGSAAFVAMALRAGSWAQRLMSFRFFRFFGKYSYGIYVLHMMVYHSPAGWLDHQFWTSHQHVGIATHLLSTAIVFSLTILVAVLSFHFFERPFLKLKRFFNYDPLHNPPSPATS